MGKVISSDESKNTIQIINSQTTVAIDILDSVVYGKSYYETPGFKNKLNFSWDIQNIPPENSLISL